MRLQYPAVVFLGIMHALALASLPYIYIYGVGPCEAAYHLLAFLSGGLGITALYHRAWAHNAVVFVRPVEYVLAILSTFTPQSPARQWISTHLKHHAHTDEHDDPYNIQRGFWWAHIEWIVLAPVPAIELPKRLCDNPVIYWQERYYWQTSTLLNIVLPVTLSLAVGSPWWGGILLSALRMTLASHVTYAVNSVCHLWGSRPFTRDVSARDVWWFPFALGEQYHNYHHAFPRDYRHGVSRFAFDPTKWFISLFARLRLAHDVFSMPDQRIAASRKHVNRGDKRYPAQRELS